MLDSNMITSLIRTWTPIVVGAIIGWFTAIGLEVDENAAVGLTAFLTAVFQGLYYLIARLLEKRFPWAGWLLGQPKQVKYTEPK